MMDTAIDTLERWLSKRLTSEANQWFETSVDTLLSKFSDRQLYIILGKIPRVIGRNDLALADAEIQQAGELRRGWFPARWTLSGAARVLLLARLGQADRTRLDTMYPSLCRTADYNELIDLYNGLSLISPSETLTKLAADGLRTNTRAVFESIAHHNPYPAENFDEQRWNHMILKALFVDSTLGPIIGLDTRKNANLTRMLHDYAKERRAADRTVSVELWRCVGPFITNDTTGELLNDLAGLLASGNKDEQRAAALALSESPDQRVAEIMLSVPELRSALNNGKLSWQFNVTKPVHN